MDPNHTPTNTDVTPMTTPLSPDAPPPPETNQPMPTPTTNADSGVTSTITRDTETSMPTDVLLMQILGPDSGNTTTTGDTGIPTGTQTPDGDPHRQQDNYIPTPTTNPDNNQMTTSPDPELTPTTGMSLDGDSRRQ